MTNEADTYRKLVVPKPGRRWEGVPWIRRASVLPRHLHVEICK